MTPLKLLPRYLVLIGNLIPLHPNHILGDYLDPADRSSSAPPAALYFYSPDRGGQHPRQHLEVWPSATEGQKGGSD
jgi:hypothetical protein